jgi:nodulation protein E
MEFGLTGPSFTVTTACASSAHAIGQAFWMVRNGLLDAAGTGGSEASLTGVNLKAWEVMRVVSSDICRPFSADRTGMSLGEGAAILTMEPLDRALARGATIYGEIVGFGMSSDAFHLTQPSESGMARAMQSALADASLDPAQITHLNAHGTATRLNDLTEAAAAQIVFGSHTPQVAVSATKSVHGHTLGAAGSLEAVATLLALQNSLLPPTINFTTPDPECPLDIVANQPRPAEVEYALSNSFAFGGLNASLAFRRWI